MARQRVVEPAGWTFWRCFASSVMQRRKEVLTDLFQTLERLGIKPLGADSVTMIKTMRCVAQAQSPHRARSFEGVAKKKINAAQEPMAILAMVMQCTDVRRADVGGEFRSFPACRGALPIA